MSLHLQTCPYCNKSGYGEDEFLSPYNGRCIDCQPAKPKQNVHPDVKIYADYSQGFERFFLRIVTISTPDFPHGLPLLDGWSCRDLAEEQAVKVQKYLDAFRRDRRSI